MLFISNGYVVSIRRPQLPKSTFREMRSIVIALLSVSVLLTGCSMPKFSLPRVQKLTVQQGNVITQEMIDRLKPGMTRSQVTYIMGQPVFRNAFDNQRWDYVYTIEVPGFLQTDVHVALFFANDVLAYFTGDLAPSSASEDDTQDDFAANPQADEE